MQIELRQTTPAADGNALWAPASGIGGAQSVVAVPAEATQLNASSGNVANASAVATLAAAAGKTNFITGFEITSAGATAASVVLATVTGLLGGTRTYVYASVAGATAANQTLSVQFSQPLRASAVNTAIVVTLPALGAGNTNAAVNAQGWQI